MTPARRPTLTFIGVTTGASSIMTVFPAWAKHWGLDADIRGLDLPLGADRPAYRAAVASLKADPLARGALVTTHKLDLFEACRDQFDTIDRFASLLGETSCLSKRPPANGSTGGAERLIAHAKDPISAGSALRAIVPAGHFAGAEAFVMGAGGSGTAISWVLSGAPDAPGGFAPSRLIVTDTSQARLDDLAALHAAIEASVPLECRRVVAPAENDAHLAALAPGSLVVNATGLGKDRPGSPLTDAAVFPQHGLVWELNYRGALDFLHQARSQATTRDLAVHDGWVYFIHGWTQVIAEVFDRPIDAEGDEIDVLTRIALKATNAAAEPPQR